MSTMDLEEEKYFVMSGMIKFGAVFVQSLGQALYHADPINTKKIKDAFPEYWAEYLPKGKADHEKEQAGE